ncbi:DJ-1/PfpI/YhbO family deglycase/protease [Spiractinospora alimapuensis]|uniref:DJ-1/PfpI/YhbO family deglycase/protease n=1 Tax=Spiractinospora alimapuensis TaxID=2820884 RepID=UPI001F252772|nr:DJ-1/PfpI/YhbO family deglycase/protease [Spiractinospora alimapuensis]QVQ51198.1 DJ-1/PfpI/YhbO family deglycase/protease [Spiractinospora alimapuensis]
MADIDLTGRRVLAITTNYGVEQDELVVPVDRLRRQNAGVDVAAVASDPVETLVHDKDPGRSVQPDVTLAKVDPTAYDLLIVPGGTLNADSLRLDEDALRILDAFTSAGRPVAAICHGPWLLVEGDTVRTKRLTSYASLKTDIRNAGGQWVDESVVVDDTGGWTLITSRDPRDLNDFVAEIDRALEG